MDKVLYKVTLYIVKILPMLIAFGYFLNSVLSYFMIDVPILSSICGMSLFTLLFMYLVSYLFKFCAYHRMFLHYILITDCINIYDYYIGMPISDRYLFTLHMSISCIILFIILYLKFKNSNKNSRTKELV